MAVAHHSAIASGAGVFAIGLGLFAAASAACALAPSVGWLIAARVQQGAGAALLMPLALALLSVAFPPQLRPKALRIFAGVGGVAVALGPLLGGAVVEGISWHHRASESAPRGHSARV